MHQMEAMTESNGHNNATSRAATNGVTILHTHTHTECHVANAIIVSQGTESTVALLHNALKRALGMLYLFPKAANYSHLSDHEERA